MSGRYSHMFCIAYTIHSDHKEGEDITPEQHAAAIRKRVDDCLAHDEMAEAVGCPVDTYDTIEDSAL
jgi:hypothetical protein